jgi:hypothetical protein
MTPTPKKSNSAPETVYTGLVELDKICTDKPQSGWREVVEHQVEQLYKLFMDGDFGVNASCGVQLLPTEFDNKSLIDDGKSTVLALVKCQELWFANGDTMPDGNVWHENLVKIFSDGLPCKFVSYADNEDMLTREAWNMRKHDEETHHVAYSTPFMKIMMVVKVYERHKNWTVASQWLQQSLGSGSNSASVIGRWIR